MSGSELGARVYEEIYYDVVYNYGPKYIYQTSGSLFVSYLNCSGPYAYSKAQCLARIYSSTILYSDIALIFDLLRLRHVFLAFQQYTFRTDSNYEIKCRWASSERRLEYVKSTQCSDKTSLKGLLSHILSNRGIRGILILSR